MSMNHNSKGNPVTPHQPERNADLADWMSWFWEVFLPAWVDHADAQPAIGFHDVLDGDGAPTQCERRTILTQGRLLYTFAHLAFLSDHSAYHHAARKAREAVSTFRKSPGLYCLARNPQGEPTGKADDGVARSYDLSFVILGLASWGKLHPGEDADELEACWQALETRLTDPATGLLLEHDELTHPAAANAPRRAQNPHMHNYEAALQAFEMTRQPIWLARAARVRAKGLEYFFDADTGTIREFITPDLSLLQGREGQYREIGHQYEWAWLLMREVELGGDPAAGDIAERLLRFADTHGIASSGAMAGAALDAVASDTSWRDETFLLWPQTELIKAHAIRSETGEHAVKAKTAALMIFRTYFAGRSAFVNQVDFEGRVIWPDALSRLLYHIVLGFTEGARASLWQGPRK